VLLDRLQPYNKKGRKCELAAPSIESKGVTRATNASQRYHALAGGPSELFLRAVCELRRSNEKQRGFASGTNATAFKKKGRKKAIARVSVRPPKYQ
jgi:hypothetical protein